MHWSLLATSTPRYECTTIFLVYCLTFLQAERDPEEEGDYMAFEQLMAEAMQKKGKDDKKKRKKHGFGHHDSHDQDHAEGKETPAS